MIDKQQLLIKTEKLLKEKQLTEAVELLKSAINRDPYWAAGHRLLGDIYLTRLEHPVYALVEYRKLQHVAEKLTDEDKLRLILAYHRRGFDDRALQLLNELTMEKIPEKLTICGVDIYLDDRVQKLRQKISRQVNEKSEIYYRKYLRQGNEFMNAGNFYRAQGSYEKALELHSEPRVYLKLARCLIERTDFAGAVKILKMIIKNDHVHDEARELLIAVYRRLGLPVSSVEKTDLPVNEVDYGS